MVEAALPSLVTSIQSIPSNMTRIGLWRRGSPRVQHSLHPRATVTCHVDAVAHPLLQRCLLLHVAIDERRVHRHLLVEGSGLRRHVHAIRSCESDSRLAEPREQLGHTLDDTALAHDLECARWVAVLGLLEIEAVDNK